MPDFGAQLKEARESRGISLRQIAAATKISVVALEALERNDFSRLPGGIFSRAFVRAYAIEVGLDPEQTVETYLEEFERADVKPDSGPRPEVTADDRAFLARQQRASRILRGVLIAIVLLVIGAVFLWRYGAGSRSAAPSGSPPAAVPPANEGPAAGPPAAPPVLTPPRTPAGGAEAAGAAQTPPAQTNQIALHLEISGDCWLRVRLDGKTAFEQTLHAGDQRDFTAEGDVYLQVGNSSAVTWTVNGQPGRDLGNPGQPAFAHLTRANLATFLK